MPDITPNEAQRKAIEHPPSPLMILAGAGTGKTFTLEYRIVYLIKHFKANPENILTITYTEKAARELKQRILNKAGKSAYTMTVGTFHSFCYRLLRDFSTEQLPALLEESEAIHMLLERFDDLKPFESNEFPLNPQRAVIESFIPFFNRARDELIEPDKMETPAIDENSFSAETAAQVNDLKRIFPVFQQWKRQMNVVDYGDMILLAYNLLNENAHILKLVQEKYQVIIVDEFQDNNFALNEIIGLIAQYHKQITVVGDEDQTIYSFRGANSYNIAEFKKRFGGEPIALEENFRSTQSILDIANASIKANTNRMETRLFAKDQPKGQLPKIYWGEKSEQLEFLSNEITHLLDTGTDNRDIAVLCRTHSQTNTIATALLKGGIPVQARIPNYFAISAVLDLVSWCQLVGNGSFQDIALFRLVEQTCGEENAHHLFNRWNRRDNTPRLELLEMKPLIIKEFPELKSLLDKIKTLQKIVRKKSAGEMVWEICQQINLFKYYDQHYSLDDRLAILNAGDFLKRAQDFSNRNPKDHGIDAFNVYVEAVMVSGGVRTIIPEEYNQLNGVRVTTIHSVKGGEFPVVFLPLLRSGSFPLYFRKNTMISRPPDEWLAYEKATHITEKEHHYEEERRLFYVAVTRAKNRLYLLAPEKATSIFMKELPENLMENINMQNHNEKKTYSDIRIKYEVKIQKALACDQFDKVHEYTSALELIAEFEKGNQIEFGPSDWEKVLQEELSGEFEPILNERLSLSASAIETYEQCPKKYRFGRIDGIPQTASKPQLIFGNIIHKVLQRFHEPEKEFSEERIRRLLNDEWKKGEFDYTVREEKFYEQGLEILSRYFQRIQDNPPNVIAREKKFSFDLNDITINGAIDRIDQDYNGIHIVDYKTSKNSSPAKSNLQLAIYSMFLEQSDSEIGGLPASATLYFLREPEKPLKSHTFTHEELHSTHNKIQDTASGIRRKEFDTKKGKHCDWCDYKHLICPAWEEGKR